MNRLSKSPKTLRSNRGLHIEWRYGDKKWTGIIDFSEGIFGTSVGRKGIATIEEQSLQLATDEVLEQFLAGEAEILDPTQQPRIVKIYGAWAYLDKAELGA